MEADLQLLSSLVNEHLINPDYQGAPKIPIARLQGTVKKVMATNRLQNGSPTRGSPWGQQPQQWGQQQAKELRRRARDEYAAPPRESRVRRMAKSARNMKNQFEDFNEETRDITGFPVKKIVAILIVIALGIAIYFRPETAWIREWISNNHEGVGFYVMIGVGALFLAYIVFK